MVNGACIAFFIAVLFVRATVLLKTVDTGYVQEGELCVWE